MPPNYEKQEVKTDTQAERLEREEEREEAAEQQQEKKKGKERAGAAGGGGRGGEKASSCAAVRRNTTNPVVLVNAILIAAAGAGLGYGAYQKHLRGALTWDMLALWSGGLGAAGLMDYFVSR